MKALVLVGLVVGVCVLPVLVMVAMFDAGARSPSSDRQQTGAIGSAIPEVAPTMTSLGEATPSPLAAPTASTTTANLPPSPPAPTTATTRPPPNPPTTAPTQYGIKPGEECSPFGAFGVSKAGHLYRCEPSPDGSGNRWRRVG